MRFLFVYETCAVQARNLVSELLVTDVHIVVAKKGELSPTGVDADLLLEHQGAEAAACQLNRKYRKNVAPMVTFTVEPKKFRFEDQQLRDWLLGDAEVARSTPTPVVAFADASAASSSLVLHGEAVTRADEIDQSRWEFAATSAELLRRLAAGDPELGSLRYWASTYGVVFAANGQVSYSYQADLDGEPLKRSSEWHLKAGDNTTAEKAARIYFTTETVGERTYVLVAYVGPHPKDGKYKANFGRLA